MFKSCISHRPVASIFGVCMCVEGGGGGGEGRYIPQELGPNSYINVGQVPKTYGF